MVAKQLLNLVQKLTTLTQKEYDFLSKMDLNAVHDIVMQKEPLLEVYEACAREIQKNDNFRESIHASGLGQEIKESILKLNALSEKAHRRSLTIHRSQKRFMDNLQKTLYGIHNPVKSYSRKGLIGPSDEQLSLNKANVSAGFTQTL